jgi:ATP-dependent DNA helicase PIF1
MLNLYPMTQSAALQILKTGANVFLTGEPGAGKTHVINEYIAWLEAAGLSVAVTASTGIAATHIGGMTIHSWSGIGVRDTLTPYDLDKIATNEKVDRRAKKARVLIIDEVSMLDARVLDMVNLVLKTVRQKPEAFGGLQIVLVGDFFQLPPVTKQGDVMTYAFQSKAWEESRFLTCYLTEQHRQEDELFLSLLKSIRQNQVEEDHYTLLAEQTTISYENIEPTKLYTHNADVDAFNNAKLRELRGTIRKFQMQGQGNRVLVESLARNCLSPETLELKEEALVMFTKNNFEKGYVNGTLGRVTSFDALAGWPIVKTSDGRTIKTEPVTWEVAEDGKVRASIEQVPLRLAWAITVHKSQGMSLDAAEIDLSRAFVYGQGYVALSRVRALAGLKLSGMNPNALIVDPRVIQQDQHFKQDSGEAETIFTDIEPTELERLQENFIKASGGRVPKPEDVKVGKPHERIQKESTHEVTKRMLQEKNSVADIARARKMTESTIWGHIEDLISEGRLALADIEHAVPADWNKVWPEIKRAIGKVGDEKLKPIYEHLDEKYDYDLIRLGRCYYRLTK